MEILTAILKLALLLPFVLLIFNLIIVVHELGHFLAARWRGLYVDRFAIWFGKPLWKKKIGGVTYILGRIPAGGYVSVPQLVSMEMVEGRLDIDPEILKKLPNAKPLDKMIVAVAGPIFSLALAFAFACVVWKVGIPTKDGTQIGYVVPDGPAAIAEPLTPGIEPGLKAGDIVKSVDGHPVSTFVSNGRDSIFWNIIDSKDKTVELVVDRDGRELTFRAEPRTEKVKFYQRDNFKEIAIFPTQEAFVGKVYENSPAEVAGLKAGDKIVAVEGQPFLHFGFISDHLKANPNQTIHFTIERPESAVKGAPIIQVPISLTPEVPIAGQKKPTPMMGVQWDDAMRWEGERFPNPVKQISDSAMMIFNTVKALTNKNSGVTVEQFGGPIAIVQHYYLLLHVVDEGWRLVLWFSVILNVNLAIMNMLPFPVLDGGHIVMSIVEMIRRKPINIRVLEILQTSFAVVLISFMLYVSFYDVQNVIPGGGGPEPVFSEKDATGQPLQAPAPPP